MAVTRIKNNQITDATVVANAKLVDYSISSAKLANNLTYESNLTITGNLTVQGNSTAIDTTITTIEDPVIVLASTQTSGAPAVDIGFLGFRGNESNIAFVWDESADEFVTAFTSTGETNTTITITSYADFHTNNANIGGNLVVSGNISITGNIANLNVTGNVTGGNLLTPGLISAAANVTGGNVLTGGAVSATANVTGGNLLTGGLISATSTITSAANITGGNVLTGGLISATATITGGNLATGGTVSATGNVTGGNVLTAGLISATSTITSAANITGGNVLTGGLISATSTITSAANITGGNVLTGGLISATANITGGNVLTGGLISATGNVTGNNIIAGNAVIGNINVSGDINVNSLTSNTFVSATGNVIGGNVLTGGLISATSTITSAANITGGNLLTGGLISATSTITSAANITGGNVLTGGVVSATANVTGGNVLTGGVVSATANVTGGNVLTGGLISAGGNITSATNVNTPNVVGATGLTISTGSGDLALNPSGNINASNNYINNLPDPAQAQDAATKEYVDNAVSTGLTIHPPVRVESPTAISGTYAQGGTTATVTDTVAGNTVVFSSAISPQVNDQYWFSNSFNGVVANTPYFVVSAPNTSAAVLSLTYSGAPVSNITSGSGLTQGVRINSGQGATLTNSGANATLVIDGVTLSNTNRVLIYTQANAVHNGVYVVSEAGNATTAWQLTRSSDMDTYIPDDIDGLDAGDYFYVQEGDSGAGESYVMTAPIGPTIIGYDNLTFTQFSASQVYTANTAAGLVLNGTVFSAKVDNNTTAFDGGGNISVKASANLTTPNIGAATGTSLSVTGAVDAGTTMSAAGNVTGGNVLTGGLISATSTITSAANITGGNVLTGGLISATSTITSAANITGGNLTTAGQVSAAANITGGNVLTGGVVSATANVTGGNLLTGGLISATSTITSAANITGGNLLTGGLISATSNITGGNLLFGSGIVSGTGNIYANNIFANISGNIDAAGSNTQIQFNDGDLLGASAGFTFDKTSNAVVANGNITGANFTTAGVVTATGNVIGGNILTGGLISATGKLDVGGQITSTGAGNAATNGGQIFLNGATNNRIDWNTNGTGAPEYTTRSAGAKVVLFPSIGGSSTDYALGVEAGALWSGIPGNDGAQFFKWYGGNVPVASLSGTGVFSATGNITGASLILTSGIIDGPAAGRITINGSDIDTDFAVDGDTVANVFYVDAGTGTASFGSSTQVTNAIVNFDSTTSIKAPVGNTAQRPATGVTGMIRFNTTNNNLELYDNSQWTAVGVPVFTVIADEQFNGDGSTVAFTLGSEQTTNSCIVSINGVVQIPTSAYSVSGTGTSTLTFTEAPLSGDLIDVREITTTTTVTSISNSSGNAVIAVSPTSAQTNVTGDLSVSGSILGGNINSTAITFGTSNMSVVSSNGNIRANIAGTTVQTISPGLVAITGDLSVSGNATLSGNILGDRIQNGTTSFDIQTASGNANINIGGTGNLAVFAPGNLLMTGNISPTANITYDLGTNTNRWKDLWLSNSTIYLGNSQISANATALIFTNPAGGQTVLAGATAGITGATVSASGNITGGNVLTGGVVSATGNITGSFILGNGSQLTGIDATSIQSGTSNVRVVSSGGNVATGVGGTSNVVVVATTGQFVTGVNSVSGNITGGNILTGGLISATGTITGASVVGGVMTGSSVSVTGTVTGASVVGGVMTGSSLSLTGAVTGTTLTGTSLTVSTGNVSCGNIVNTNANGVGNIGSTGTRFNQVFALASSAQYADLAEKYTADADYTPGTVVVFGGTAEVTVDAQDADRRVAGVVSTNPAYIMNDTLESTHIATVALTGRVPCFVTGSVRKGDLMVSAGNGRARAEADPRVGTVIGKALADFDGAEGTIEVVVGRF